MGVEVSKINDDLICQAYISVLNIYSDEPLHLKVCTESQPPKCITQILSIPPMISQHVYFRIPYTPPPTTTITALNLAIYWDLPTDYINPFSPIIRKQRIIVNTHHSKLYDFGEINLGNVYHPMHSLSSSKYSALSIRKRNHTVTGIILIIFLLFNIVMIIGILLRVRGYNKYYWKGLILKRKKRKLTIQDEEKQEEIG